MIWIRRHAALVVSLFIFAGGAVAFAQDPLDLPLGPPSAPVPATGPPEPTGSQADVAATFEGPGVPSAPDFVNCASSDPRLDFVPDYAPAPSVSVETTESSDPVPPVVFTPATAIAQFLALPIAPKANPASYSELQRSAAHAVWVARERTRTVSAVTLAKSGGSWLVTEFSACGSYVNPDVPVASGR